MLRCLTARKKKDLSLAEETLLIVTGTATTARTVGETRSNERENGGKHTFVSEPILSLHDTEWFYVYAQPR